MAHLIPIPFMAVTVSLLVWSRLADRRRGEVTWKPISSALFILVALLSLLRPSANAWYTWTLTAGLLLSMGGDLALMVRTRRAFLIGLVLFLLAHVVYATVWTVANGFHRPDLIIGVLLAVAAAAVFACLRPGLGSMQVPVLLYVAVICFMVNRAASTFFGDYFTNTQAWLLTAGAVLFWVSDLLLAINRFRRPFRLEPLGLYAYYGGQLLIALSASYFG